MLEPPYYDSPPAYSPPYSTTSKGFHPPRSVHSPQGQYAPYSCVVPPDCNVEVTPQHFYRWFSPPGFVKTFQGTTALMCFIIFACVVSTLVWDTNETGYGSYSYGFAGGFPGTELQYYGSYSYKSNYITPQSAKAAMISVVAINFLVSLGFFVGNFSRSRITRGCRFYLVVFICDIVLAVLQGIIDIIFVIGVNPMSQSSQSTLYNPILKMCQSSQGSPSLSSSLGASFPGSYPMYNQHLHHYCYMDPEEAVAFVLGLIVVSTLSLSAYYAYKTRSKIWRHGKANIYWDKPWDSEGQDVLDWVDDVGELCSTQQAPTVVSERGTPDLRVENSMVSYSNGTVSIHSVGNYKNNREKRNVSEHQPAAKEIEPQYETGYTTGDTGNELDPLHIDYLYRLYPVIISDEQRHQYKKEFDSDLASYKTVCAEMDEISDQMHKLSRELDMLDEDSTKYKGVADEYNRLKSLKRTPGYQAKKRHCKELRQKLFHIKCLVKNYDQGLC